MNAPSNLERSLASYENVLFAKWLSARRSRLGQPIVDEQKVPSAKSNPSEPGSTS